MFQNATLCNTEFLSVFDNSISTVWTVSNSTTPTFYSTESLQIVFSLQTTGVQLGSFSAYYAIVPMGSCPTNCSGHGLCTDNGCLCDEGFSGTSCSEFTCYPSCGTGSCVAENLCECASGFFGIGCNTVDICGTTFTAASDSILIPFSTYPDNCSLLIAPQTWDTSQTISFSIAAHFGERGSLGYIYVYDGDSSSAPLLGQIKTSTATFYASGAYMLIIFSATSDSGLSASYFLQESKYNMVSPQCQGAGPTLLLAEGGTYTYGHEDDPRLLSCDFIISPLAWNSSLSIMLAWPWVGNHNYFTVYDGPSTAAKILSYPAVLAPYEFMPIISSGSALYIHISTTVAQNSSFTYSLVPKPDCSDVNYCSNAHSFCYSEDKCTCANGYSGNSCQDCSYLPVNAISCNSPAKVNFTCFDGWTGQMCYNEVCPATTFTSSSGNYTFSMSKLSETCSVTIFPLLWTTDKAIEIQIWKGSLNGNINVYTVSDNQTQFLANTFESTYNLAVPAPTVVVRFYRYEMASVTISWKLVPAYDCSAINNCSGHGLCVKDNLCSCKDYYTDPDCSNFYIPCVHGSTTVLPGTCFCNSGWYGSSCDTPSACNSSQPLLRQDSGDLKLVYDSYWGDDDSCNWVIAPPTWNKTVVLKIDVLRITSSITIFDGVSETTSDVLLSHYYTSSQLGTTVYALSRAVLVNWSYSLSSEAGVHLIWSLARKGTLSGLCKC